MRYEVSYNQQQRLHLRIADEEPRILTAEELSRIADVLNTIIKYKELYSDLKEILCQE